MLIFCECTADRATSLDIYAMGAAIPLALSLALAIRDALPGGSPNEQGEEGSVKMTTRTGSMVVPDEITPQDEVRRSVQLSFCVNGC